MKKNILLRLNSIFVVALGLLLWAGNHVQAQSGAFTLDEAILGGAKNVPASLANLGWVPGTEQYAYTAEKDGKWVVLAGVPSKKDEKVLFSLDDLNKAADAADLAAFPRFPAFTWTGPNTIRFEASNSFYGYDFVTQKAARIVGYPDGAANLDLSSKDAVAYTIEQNLYVAEPEKAPVAISNESNDHIRYGEATHRFEFGISKGTFWAPNGSKLAFYRTDETMVTDYPILDYSNVPATSKNVKYPFAGQKSHHVTVGVFDLATQKTVYLQTGGDPEHYLTNITWSPDSKEVWVVEINRGQDQITLNRYDAGTGARIATVFEERHPKYLEPKNGPTFLPNAPGEFIWQSERDGFNHLYHYKVDGTLLGQLTSGPWMVTTFLGFDAEAKNFFIESTKESATDRHIYMVGLKTKTVTPLTPGAGTHRAWVHPSGKYVIDSWTSIDVPRVIRIQDTKGATLRTLLTASDPLAQYNLPKAELLQIKAADNSTDLWCRMFKPSGFDPSKKYPVIIYVYNGPSTQLITNTYMGAAPAWMPWMAQQGYIVWTVDGRGSANRGLAFEQATFRNLGEVENADQMAGVSYLKGLPYVDFKRMVVHGWSYGGFMTCNMLMRNPGVFRAGVAGGPVIDWSWYEVMYTERYMDTPQENPEGYKNAQVINYIDDLEAKLLLIHGTSDDVVVWQHSIELLEAAIAKGVQLDYFVYPMHPHNVRGKDRLHLMRKVLTYLMDANK